MSDAIIAADERIGQLFDMRKEAEAAGRLIEDDIAAAYPALLARGAVQKGALYELLGQGKPVQYAVERPGYTCLSFAACNAAFRDNETYSSESYGEMPAIRAMGRSILQMGGAEHRSYRATLQPMFIKPKALMWWRERWIDGGVRTLTESLHGADRADLGLQFCARLPMHVATTAVGFDPELVVDFRDALTKMMGLAIASPDEARASAGKVDRMLRDLIARRRTDPKDDVVTHMLGTTLELPDESTRPLTDDEVMSQLKVVILAGGGTTWRQLGITLWALLTHPDQLADVKADRALISAAVEESLRWNPTNAFFARVVTRDAVLEGAPVPAGSRLDICVGAGNRDPSRWSSPEAYDIHREPVPHLGFSIGPHQCLGMNVARAEMVGAINALLDDFPNLRPDPEAAPPLLCGSLEQRAMTAVPVRLD